MKSRKEDIKANMGRKPTAHSKPKRPNKDTQSPTSSAPPSTKNSTTNTNTHKNIKTFLCTIDKRHHAPQGGENLA